MVSTVHNVSKVTELQSLALSIFNVCACHSISLEIKWIPRSFNYQADLLSRTIDFDDYTIHDDVFRMLDCKWGPHTVDRFACSYNAKVCTFLRYVFTVLPAWHGSCRRFHPKLRRRK